MQSHRDPTPISVIGPDGKRMTRADLPSPDTTRWVARRKAAVVAAVNGGLLSGEDACRIYDLSEEELESWKAGLARHGMNALRTTALQRYRSTGG